MLFDLPAWLVMPFLFVLGAVIGSFLNVCIYRIPQHEDFWKSLRSVVSPPSSCPNCRNLIPSRDNIPILGWFLLGGRCRFCRQQFSVRYALIELLNASLFVLVYWMEIPANLQAGIQGSCLYTNIGPQGFVGSEWLSPQAVLMWRYIYHMVLIEALVVATFIDFDLRIIPDGVTLPAMFVGVVGGALVGQVHIVPAWFQRSDLSYIITMIYDIWGDGAPPSWMKTISGWWWMSGTGVPSWFAAYPHWHGLLVSLAGLVVGGGIVWIVRFVGHLVLRQEAMGFGDVILLAMIGSFLGWQAAVMVFIIAPVIALIVVIATWLFFPQREIPYGPYLSLAALIVILGWKWLWSGTPTFRGFEGIFELGPLLPFFALAMSVGLYGLLQCSQYVKWCLGIELYPPEWTEVWTSADQLSYMAMEQVDPQQGRWRQTEWPGASAGAGQLHTNNWKQPSANLPTNGWTQQWQRRPGSRS